MKITLRVIVDLDIETVSGEVDEIFILDSVHEAVERQRTEGRLANVTEVHTFFPDEQ